jgi:hypothetical protein
MSFGVINDPDILHVSHKFLFFEKDLSVLTFIDDILISTSYPARIHATATIRSLLGLLTKVGGSTRRGRKCIATRKMTVRIMISKKVMNPRLLRCQELFVQLNCIGDLLRLSTRLELIVRTVNPPFCFMLLSLHIAATQFCFVLYFAVVAEAVPKRILELMNVEKLTRNMSRAEPSTGMAYYWHALLALIALLLYFLVCLFFSL